jgi:aminopeptidase
MLKDRYKKLAKILVNYSTKIKSGEKVLIHMQEVEAFPLVREIYEESIRKGAETVVIFDSHDLAKSKLRCAGPECIAKVTDLEYKAIDWADVWMGIRGVRNPYELSSIPAHKVAAHRQAYGKLAEKRVEKCRWILCWVPTEAFAHKARLGTDELYRFFFKATLKDWKKESQKYHRLAKKFQRASTVQIVGEETDITLSTKGRTYVVADGQNNMPDGEIFTAPVESATEGKVYFEFPAPYSGQVVEGIRLEFVRGKVVKASADKNEKLLKKVLSQDKGASRLGELGIGLNYGINRFVFDTLFDEKIGGTIHLALGRGYKECGSRNRSSEHWDLVKDLRKKGEIYLDGKKIFQKGKYLI